MPPSISAIESVAIVEELDFTGGTRSQVGEKCVDGSYAIGDEVWSGNTARGDGSGQQDTTLSQTSLTRGPAVTAALNRFFALDTSGVMPWAFQAGPLDLMMHDACRGMDPIYHTDWADLFQAYCQKANQLDNRSASCLPDSK